LNQTKIQLEPIPLNKTQPKPEVKDDSNDSSNIIKQDEICSSFDMSSSFVVIAVLDHMSNGRVEAGVGRAINLYGENHPHRIGKCRYRDAG